MRLKVVLFSILVATMLNLFTEREAVRTAAAPPASMLKDTSRFTQFFSTPANQR